MSLHRKITFIFFALLIIMPVYGLWYVRSIRPAPVPPRPREEITITIIPGWDARDIAKYLVGLGFASSTADV